MNTKSPEEHVNFLFNHYKKLEARNIIEAKIDALDHKMDKNGFTPNDLDEMAVGINTGLSMAKEEQLERLRAMQKRISDYNGLTKNDIVTKNGIQYFILLSKFIGFYV